MKKILLAAGLLLSAESYSEPLSLNQLKNLNEVTTKIHQLNTDDEASIRFKALKAAANSVGAQYGYIKRFEELEKQFKDQQETIDSIFDFSTIIKMTADEDDQLFFQPPVIIEAKNVMALSEDQSTVRVSGILYEVKRPAQLTLRPPNWRQYLYQSNKFKPELPNKALLPKDPLERDKWKEWVSEGWEAGIRQAETEMKNRVKMLGEDFNGMLKYMRLIEEGKIIAPNISKLKQKVTKTFNKMSVNDAVYQLNIPAQFNGNFGNWHPLYGDSRDSLALPIELRVSE